MQGLSASPLTGPCCSAISGQELRWSTVIPSSTANGRVNKRRYERPWQGYVVDWKHDRYKWEALVVYQDETLDGSPLVWRWCPVEQLRPLYPDPNPRRELNY